MTADMPPLDKARLRKERTGVLVALAAQPPPPPDSHPSAHPSAETLAAFSEGRLNAEERERVLAHLDACADCYNEWLAVANVLAADPPRQLPGPGWWPWGALPRRRRRRLFWSGAGIALAASLVLAVLAPWRPDVEFPRDMMPPAALVTPPRQTDVELPALVERAYAIAQVAPAPDLRDLAARQTLPWEEPTQVYGLTSAAAPEAARAFGSGLWEGRTRLAGDRPPAALPVFLAPAPARPDGWRDTEWADYAALGRWVFLLQTVCRAPQEDAPAFWDQQAKVAEAMRTGLARRTDDDALARPAGAIVGELAAALNDPELATNRVRLCMRIERHATRLNALLAPAGPREFPPH